MRIPFPERIPIQRVAVFALVLFAIQTLERTPLYFSVGCMAFIVTAGFAFNAGGGLTRASGAYVFFYAMLDVIIGLCYKAFLGEPADSNLRDPHGTIKVFAGGMIAMFAAVTVSRRMSRKVGLLQNLLKYDDMYRASIGCIVVGIGGPFVLGVLGGITAPIASAFNQLNQLVPLAIIIGTMHEIYRTGGKRSISMPVFLAGGYFFLFYGLLAYSKQGLLLPIACWALPVCALRYRLSRLQTLSLAVSIYFIFAYLVPYAQVGRNGAGSQTSFTGAVETSIDLLTHPSVTQKTYVEAQVRVLSPSDVHYFSTPSGFWDRLQFLSVDDSLIDVTDRGTEFGLAPIVAQFLNVIPHFLWHDKPTTGFGNQYAHELGGLSEDDFTTGISFSPTAEAYHMARWFGIFVIAPAIWVLLFVVFDSLFGDLRVTPWGLLVLSQIGHVAPEGALTGAIYFVTFGVEIYTFCALFGAWIAPKFAVVILGRDRKKELRRREVLPVLTPRVSG